MSPKHTSRRMRSRHFRLCCILKMPPWYAAGGASPARFLCLTIDTMTNTRNMLIFPIIIWILNQVKEYVLLRARFIRFATKMQNTDIHTLKLQ